MTSVYFHICRRGREEKYVSGTRVLAENSLQVNWTSSRASAQKFSTQEEAERFVLQTFGASGFNTLRLLKMRKK